MHEPSPSEISESRGLGLLGLRWLLSRRLFCEESIARDEARLRSAGARAYQDETHLAHALQFSDVPGSVEGGSHERRPPTPACHAGEI